MSELNRVVWSEGMFLRPQHFQQHDRYLDARLEQRVGACRAFTWGLSTGMAIDSQALALGKVAAVRASGVLPDGTPFSFPEHDPPPVPVDVPDDASGREVLLALPLRRVGVPDTGLGNDADSMARYTPGESATRNSVMGAPDADAEVPIEVGRLRLRLLLDTDDHAGYACIPVARVAERHIDGQVRLDPAHIPSCTDHRASERLHDHLEEVERLLRTRGEALAGRVAESGRGGAAEMAEFLRLQAINRFEPLLHHIVSASAVHPEDAYRLLVQLAGELATFTRPERRPVSLPSYRHERLAATFEPLMAELRRSLTLVDQPTAVPISLDERRFGVHVGAVNDAALIADATFVLAVTASLPAEKLRAQVPRQIKVGPRELIRDLVNANLPGIGLTPLPITPRQLPYHSGAQYFELDRGSSFWEKLETPSGFALHVSGEFPGLELELWAVRG